MSYSSLMTKIWPPPNDEVKSRLERLQELKQLREKREINVGTTATPSDPGVTSEGSRLSRRQLLSTRTLPTLRRQEERRLKSTLEKKSQGEQERTPGDGVSRGDYGGARPKNFSSSLRTSEILTSIKNSEPQGGRVERYRTSSAESDTFDERHPSENVISRSDTTRLTSIGTLGSLANEGESEVKVQDVSVESDSTDHVEDIESFKQSLFGTVSVINESGTKSVSSSDQVLTPFKDISGIINPLPRRATPVKSENRSQIGDSSRWRKNVSGKSPEKVNSLSVSGEETINKALPCDSVENGVSDSDTTENEISVKDEICTKTNSTSGAAIKQTKVSDKDETLSVNESSENGGNVLLFDGENITVSNDSQTETIQDEGGVPLNVDTELESTPIEPSSEILDRDGLPDSSRDQVVHGSFNVSDLTSDFSVKSQANMSDYRDSILNESDSIFDFMSGSGPQDDGYSDGHDSWASEWSSVADGRRGERPSLYTSGQSSWQTDRSAFDRSGGYAPKPSRRTVLTAPNRSKATTKITRYSSLPSSADSRVSDIRSRYLNRDHMDSYTNLYGGGYEMEESSVHSYRETKQQDISSRLGNILSDSFKKFDSVLDGSDLLKKTEEPARSLRRSNSHRVESVTDSKIGRYRKTSDIDTDSTYRSNYDTSYSSVPQPNLDMHEFISNIRNRTSGVRKMSDGGISGYNKPLARAGGVSSVLENAKKMLLGIKDDEPEMDDAEADQFEDLRRQTEILTESLEESGKIDDGDTCEGEEQLEEDAIDNFTEAVLEKGDIIKLSSQPEMEDKEMEEGNLQSVELDDETVLVNKTNSESVTEESEANKEQNFSSNEKENQIGVKSDSLSKNVKRNDTSSKPQAPSKGKNKKKKKGKKKKESENKSEAPSSNESKSQNGKKIEISQTDDVLTVTIEEEESSVGEGMGSVGKQFDSMIEDIDHQSEKTSVATDDLLSLGEGQESVSSQSESSNSIQQSEKSKGSSNEATNSKKSDFATLEEEEVLMTEDKNLKNETDNFAQADTEHFETASEEEFYETMPAELMDEEGNTFVEHREQFIYVTSGSKVRKRKLSKRSLLGEKNQEGSKPQADMDSSRIGHVREWMDSNIFPSNNTLNEKDLGVRSSELGSRLSVASTIGDFDSRGSLDSKDKSEEVKTLRDDSVLSTGTSRSSVASVKRNTSVQTHEVSVKDSFTQMLIKARNIGVQVDVEVMEKLVQTLGEFVCPCCKHKFNVQEALGSLSDDGQKSKENDVQKVKEELKLKLPASNEEEIKTVKSKSSSSSSSKSSSSRNSMATPPKSPSAISSTRRSPHGTPREKSPSVTPRKQSPSPVKKIHSATEASTRKSPVCTPRKQSPSRKSPGSTPRKQSPASTPRKQSPAREGVISKNKKLSPSNSTDQSTGDALKENSKVRKERVASVQNLLYQNGEQTTEKKPDIAKKPTTPKVKREKSFERQKREASADRRSDDGSSEKNDLPGYMQPTKSSRRKKSIGNKEDLLDDGRQKKGGTPTAPRKNETEKEDQEAFPTVSDNPFIRSDRQRSSAGSHGQRSSGKWYRKEPLKTEDDGKKGKTKSPKKQRSISTSSASSEKNLFSESSVVKSDRKLRSSEKLDLSGLGSQSSLLETDLDEAMGCRSDRSETSQGSESIHETVETIAFQTNSVFSMGPDLKSYAENVSRNIAEMEVMKLNGDTEHNEKKSPIQLSLPPGAESKEADLEVTKTLDAKGESTAQHKLLSDEEQAGVPLETEQEEEEVAPVRVNLSSWDPTKLLQDLYTVKLLPDNAKDISDKFVAMEGLMEKLPMNKKKATLLKTWKRRFFRAKDGWLYYYETSNRDKPSDTLQLMGGKVDDLGNRILGIDDGRGKYLMVRCPSDKEYGQWKLALESQTADNVRATYVRPVLSCPPNPQRKVILIDIGSSAIRAGILGEQPTLPSLFFPNMVAGSGDDKDLVVGIEAFKPEHRKALTKTVRSMDKVDKFSIDMSTIGAVFKKVLAELKVEPAEYWVMISTPQNLGDKIRAGLMEILIDTYHVQGVCMVMQSLLALYSYNATSGIIVDVGERMEILPIFDGFVIEGGVSMQSYGGQKVLESLNSCLHGYKFSTPIQQLIVRYVMEQSCYLVNDYKDTLKKCEQDPENYRTTIYLNNFDLPQGATMEVTHDYSCFKSPEGFFNTDLWGMDYPCVHKLVFQAIQSCPIDSRKRMYRAVYLSGGVTMLPGFAERLQSELQKLAPPSVMVEVHASPQRYHSAYIGACSLASMEQFQQICITAEEWKKDGVKTFKKWNMSG